MTPAIDEDRVSQEAAGAAHPHARTSRPMAWTLWLGVGALALFAGYLLFAHGCHGDEDNELWSRAGRLTQGTALAAAP